jgi:ABC-type cobalamin/Fe3+-siderophores transport system ATPase subunit
MQVGQAGFVPIQNLSAGQRCTAVFPLLLRNTRGPLVIDQPEDNLDNRHIAEVIAPDLLNKKKDQQFIATSHNANLVVLTDSDLILHAESDGKSGELVQRGFFSCAGNPIKNSVIEVLDGGEQALLARQRKYGIGK